jgi:hypothetical protein
MFSHHDRRDFLRVASAGAIAGLGDLAFLSKLRPVTAEETKLDPKLVRLGRNYWRRSGRESKKD